jgi:hypothetical protein
MSEQDSNFTAKELEQRQELFRYTDTSHPVIEILFNFKLDNTALNSVLEG